MAVEKYPPLRPLLHRLRHRFQTIIDIRPSRFLINNWKDRPMILEYLTPPVTAQMLRTSVTLCRR